MEKTCPICYDLLELDNTKTNNSNNNENNDNNDS